MTLVNLGDEASDQLRVARFEGCEIQLGTQVLWENINYFFADVLKN